MLADLHSRVLQRFLAVRLHQLAAAARRRPLRLWLIAARRSPWDTPSSDASSVAADLRAFESAAAELGRSVELSVSAIFIEPDAPAYHRLVGYLSRHARAVSAHALHGDLATHAAAIAQRLGDDPAVLLVDDVRSIDDAAAFVVAPRRELLVELPGDPGDDATARLRSTLAARWRTVLAATLAVPHPDGAWHRLLLATPELASLRALRDVERGALDDDAAAAGAGRRPVAQLGLPFHGAAGRRHQTLREAGLTSIERELLAGLSGGPRTFAALAASILEWHHVTWDDVAAQALSSARTGALQIRGIGARERTLKDAHVLTLPERALVERGLVEHR